MKNQLRINPVPCTSCMNCIVACSHHHTGAYGTVYSALQLVLDPFAGIHRFNHCRQCVKALCASACPVNAITWSESTKAWKLNRELCTQCGRCVDVCPFKALPWPNRKGFPIKCDLCDGKPECVDACQFGVLTYEPDTEPVFTGIPDYDLDPKLGKE